MTYQRPCEDTEKRDDWFIAKDGKQYPDDEFLTDDHAIEILETANELGLVDDERQEYIIRRQDEIEEEMKRQALINRRKARDACYECYFRTDCLDVALTNETIKSGTWGGYYEEQLRILKTQLRRKNRATEEQEGS